MWKTAVVAVYLALLFAPAARALAEGPPKGVRHTSVAFADILAAERRAAGSAAQSAAETWQVLQEGETSTLRFMRRGADYRTTVSHGPFTTGFGRMGNTIWRQNANGQTMVGAQTSDDVLLPNDPDQASTEIAAISENGKLLGEVLEPCGCYVVEYRTADIPHWAFFDKTSGQLIRIEYDAGDRRLVTTFADFRTSDGWTRPWHIHTTFGVAEEDVDATLLSVTTGADVGPGDVAIPRDRRQLGEWPNGVTRTELAATFIQKHIIVRLNIQGRDADFLLDSGASGSILDRGFARGLGILPPGTAAGDKASRERSDVIVWEMHAGAMRMHDFAAKSLPFSWHLRDPNMRIAGLIGYDLFDAAVVHIDYPHHRVELIDRNAFSLPQDDFTEVDVSLQDGVPLAPAQIGASVGTRFVIDTGADSLFVLPHFFKAHPDDLWDQGGGQIVNQNYPYPHFAGFGGPIQTRATEVASFTFGSARFTHVGVEKEVGGGRLVALSRYDGLIGYPLLRFYELYFDYANQRVVLVPGDMLKGSGRPQ